MRNKVAISIDRLRAFEPPEGYYLAFSGGKDSQCIYHLAKESGVKFDAHYNITTVDPPELIYFIREHYPDVSMDSSGSTMWKLIEKRGLPRRRKRFCCEVLKEHGGESRICVTGVRRQESKARNERRPFEVVTPKKENKMLFEDNGEGRQMFESCTVKGKRIVNPIIDWSESDVWEFLSSRKLPHCCLYDKGFTRLGCIGCPNSNMEFEFSFYPKYRANYIRAIKRFLKHRESIGKSNFKYGWDNDPEKVMQWWIRKTAAEKQCDGQLEMGGDESV